MTLHKLKKNAALIDQIESKIKEEQTVIEKVGTYFAKKINTFIQHDDDSTVPMNEKAKNVCARQLNINMGDQKNTHNPRLW